MTTLDRSGVDGPPIRIVHLGLGAFHRAHQAWYTQHAEDAQQWGIAAFSSRGTALADALQNQRGRYTLVTRDSRRDRFEVVESIVEARHGSDTARLRGLVADPRVALVTLTVTEAGYSADADTPVARLVDALAERRRTAGTPIALVGCDNLADNAGTLEGAVRERARRAQPDLERWIDGSVSFVATSVDRITPRPTSDLTALVARETGFADAAAVVTEPFSEWVLAGEFPAGRPRWETAGAQFVDDIAPWKTRKLWLLNGAHTALAATGRLRGHRTVADAVADPICRRTVDAFWAEAVRHLPGLDAEDYCRRLIARFSNARIEHLLAQIADNEVAKAGIRIAPVAAAELRQGREGAASTEAIGAVLAAAGIVGAGAVRQALGDMDERLARSSAVLAAVVAATSRWSAP